MVSVALFYVGVVCIIPLMIGAMAWEFPELRNNPTIQEYATQFAMLSPFTVMMFLYRELGSYHSENLSTVPFYLGQAFIIAACDLIMQRQGRRLRLEYSAEPTKENR